MSMEQFVWKHLQFVGSTQNHFNIVDFSDGDWPFNFPTVLHHFGVTRYHDYHLSFWNSLLFKAVAVEHHHIWLRISPKPYLTFDPVLYETCVITFSLWAVSGTFGASHYRSLIAVRLPESRLAARPPSVKKESRFDRRQDTSRWKSLHVRSLLKHMRVFSLREQESEGYCSLYREAKRRWSDAINGDLEAGPLYHDGGLKWSLKQV